MKYLITIALLAFGKLFFAPTTYYITPSGSGTGTGLDSANTMSYANLFNKALAFGDVVRLKGGNVYSGQHYAKDGVTYTRYSSGVNPIISGFTTLSGWTPQGTIANVYYVSLDLPILHGVTVDGNVKAMGRYPNTGYLSYESHTGNTSITDNQLSNSPNWVGAEVVIRKMRWVLDRHKVTAHTVGGTLTYTADNFYGSNSSYDPIDGNGYFIQGHISTLDQDGEWYYDNPNNRLYIYSTTNPAGRVIKASTVDQVVPLNGSANITFQDIDFEGGNTVIQDNGATNINIINCNFRQAASNAIYGINTVGLTVTGGSITDALNNGVLVIGGATNTLVNGTTIRRSGTMPGMGASSEPSYCGIYIVGNGTTVKNCVVTSSGWNGVEFMGSDVLIDKNYIDGYGLSKDDCGGVYTYNGDNATVTNRRITNNIVLNGIGAQAGTEGDLGQEAYGKAGGIYLDDGSHNVICDSNTVSTSPWMGIFIHNCVSVTLRRNLVYNHQYQLLIAQSNTPSRNLLVTNNEFTARTATQRAMHILTTVSDNPALFGTFNNNWYSRPVDDNLTIMVDNSYTGGTGPISYTLATWKSTFNQDLNSTKSVATTTDPANIRFDYNYSPSTASVSLPGRYRDVEGATYSSVNLQPYGGDVLLYEGPLPTNNSNWIELRLRRVIPGP